MDFRASSSLELNGFGCFCKGTESSSGIFEIEYLGIAIVFVVHMSEIGVGIQHGFLSFKPVIFHKFTGQADPLSAMESTDLRLGICQKLMRGGLDLAGLNVQLAFENMCGAKGTDTGLITFDGGQIIYTSIFQKFTYLFHDVTSCYLDHFNHTKSSRMCKGAITAMDMENRH